MTRRILVLGATGPTGRLVVRGGLSGGHEVTALVRNPASFAEGHERLRVMQGDARDPAAVAGAVEGQDAVLSILGQPFSPTRPVTLFSEAARNVLEAMRHHGVRRFIGVTSGATSPRLESGSPFEWLFKTVIGRTAYADMRRMEALVTSAEVDWTIVRPARLDDRPPSHQYRVAPGYVVPGMFWTARADLAELLVRVVSDDLYVRQAIAIATPRAARPGRTLLQRLLGGQRRLADQRLRDRPGPPPGQHECGERLPCTIDSCIKVFSRGRDSSVLTSASAGAQWALRA
ncbi:MAG TPA: SDR family oxidoreductase [Methylomirabilota bacterium]|nr:SDR family oxidoreductase [Methylomirabilota bacterium]